MSAHLQKWYSPERVACPLSASAAVTHESAGHGKLAHAIDRWHQVFGCESGKLLRTTLECRRFCMKSKMEELSFTYFPENYRWSHGLLIGLNMAPWGGAEIGEVNRIGIRLKNRIGDDDAWFAEWAREARDVESRGRACIAEGRMASGAQYLQRASAYYHV